jgi:hypothetical protein
MVWLEVNHAVLRVRGFLEGCAGVSRSIKYLRDSPHSSQANVCHSFRDSRSGSIMLMFVIARHWGHRAMISVGVG